MAFVSTLINKTNSNSYTDILGLQLGINRFVGEDNTSFLERLYKASGALKDSSARGINENLCSNLSLSNYQGISIASLSPIPISVSSGVLSVGTNSLNLFSLEKDTYMTWLMLSDVVSRLNTLPGIIATLLSDDLPAFCLPKQMNSTLTISEPVTVKGLTYTVLETGLIADSIIWNATPPNYTVTGDIITFDNVPQANTTITYKSLISPYTLVSSDIGILSLSEPAFISAATTSDNILGYQIREALQEIMSTDRSYWKK